MHNPYRSIWYLSSLIIAFSQFIPQFHYPRTSRKLTHAHYEHTAKSHRNNITYCQYLTHNFLNMLYFIRKQNSTNNTWPSPSPISHDQHFFHTWNHWQRKKISLLNYINFELFQHFSLAEISPSYLHHCLIAFRRKVFLYIDHFFGAFYLRCTSNRLVMKWLLSLSSQIFSVNL